MKINKLYLVVAALIATLLPLSAKTVKASKSSSGKHAVHHHHKKHTKKHVKRAVKKARIKARRHYHKCKQHNKAKK